jgi:superfamily II DNA/RNA helicase
MSKNNIKPQHVLYSATYTEDVVQYARKVVGDFKMFQMKKESLKLKGVKNMKIKCQDALKDEFV